MRERFAVVVSLLALAVVPSQLAAQATPARASSSGILGEWRFVRAQVAPWANGGKPVAPIDEHWIGRTIRFEPHRVAGPGVLRCANAVYTPTRFDADALFQGALPAPPRKAAASLGLVAMPVTGTSLNCDSGLFELHRPDATTLLLGLNDVIWTLDRSPGAFAGDSTPPGAVQRLLELHFGTSMAFDAKHAKTRARWLSDALNARIARYFAKPMNPNEAPAIDGDPFTDTQEYPTRFSVGAAEVRGDVATVPVRFTDGRRVRTVHYLLRRQRSGWRVDDLRYENGETLSGWLK